jgi:predicted RNA-binding Zn ribbon-like protein
MGVDLSWLELKGGRLSLDFANTLDDRLSATPTDHLTDYATLVAWAAFAGALDAAAARRLTRRAAAEPAAAAAVLAEAKALREAMVRTLVAGAEGRAPAAADLAQLNAHLSRSAASPQLVFDGERFAVGFAASDELTAPLDAVVRDAAELLLGPERSRVHVCESASGCGWLFLDTTKSRTRRWCDMKICGNRAKARRHYARAKASES